MTAAVQLSMFGMEDEPAVGVGEVRDPLQRHYTPQKLADLIMAELCARLGWVPRIFVEPSCGEGTFLESAITAWPGVHTIGVDIDPGAEGLSMCDEPHRGDWLDVSGALVARCLGPRVLVCGNTPFGAANAAQRAETIAHVQGARKVGDATSLILPWAMLGGVPSYASIMHSKGAPVEAWPFFPRPWPEHLREAAAYLWRRGVVPDGTNVRWLEKWDK